jgi:hypothetical protein
MLLTEGFPEEQRSQRIAVVNEKLKNNRKYVLKAIMPPIIDDEDNNGVIRVQTKYCAGRNMGVRKTQRRDGQFLPRRDIGVRVFRESPTPISCCV